MDTISSEDSQIGFLGMQWPQLKTRLIGIHKIKNRSMVSCKCRATPTEVCSSSHPFNSMQVHKQRQMSDANNTCPPSPLLHTLEQIPHTVFSPGNVLYSLIPLLMGSTNSYCISYLPKEGYFYLKCWVHLCLSNATFFSNTPKRLGFFLSFSNSHGK